MALLQEVDLLGGTRVLLAPTDRESEGGRTHHRADGPRRPHDVRRVGGDAGVGPDRGAPQDHRHRPPGAAANRRLRPRASVGLPVALGVASGLNAMAHCVDSLWAPRADPILSALAGEASGRWHERCAASSATSATWRPERAVSTAPTSLPRPSPVPAPVCTTRSVTPSAATSTSRTPRPTAWSCRTCSPSTHQPPPPQRPASRPPSASPDAVSALLRLYDDLGAPRALRDLGMSEDGIEECVDLGVNAAQADNPTPVTAAGSAGGAAPVLAPASSSTTLSCPTTCPASNRSPEAERRQRTCSPYISPSGSAMSSIRVPSGSRK